jgi:glutamate--cysteine ligase catalytic subunit
MEVQLTDFENAAFVVFVVLLTRVVLAFDLALYLPLSKVDENMRRAQGVDSVTKERFFFRKYLAPLDRDDHGTGEPNVKKSRSSLHLGTTGSPSNGKTSGKNCGGAGSSPTIDDAVDEDAYEEMSMDEIFNGKGPYYPGLLPLVYAYLDYIQCDPATYSRVNEYLEFIGQRARGEVKTAARWMRDFVTSHPSYKNDSVVPPDIALDLMLAAKAVGDGSQAAPDLLGRSANVQKINVENAYGTVLKGQLSAAERNELVSKYMQRASLMREDTTPRGKTRTSSSAGTREF